MSSPWDSDRAAILAHRWLNDCGALLSPLLLGMALHNPKLLGAALHSRPLLGEVLCSLLDVGTGGNIVTSSSRTVILITMPKEQKQRAATSLRKVDLEHGVFNPEWTENLFFVQRGSKALQLRGDLIQTYRIVRGRECALEFADFFELAGTEHLQVHPFNLQRKLVHMDVPRNAFCRGSLEHGMDSLTSWSFQKLLTHLNAKKIVIC
ncbi:unnamed protein product [Schistocephalus solidus]|uniref:HECT domain-containing protein n=1 Tax=Schistocephalus solidus TaxID=70667 RepID=A0A183T5T5_SCHSO|nr:unnamed protein product [Schistocephalus solidus]